MSLRTVNVVEINHDGQINKLVSFHYDEQGYDQAKELFRELVRENQNQDKPLTEQELEDCFNYGYFQCRGDSPFTVAVVYSD